VLLILHQSTWNPFSRVEKTSSSPILPGPGPETNKEVQPPPLAFRDPIVDQGSDDDDDENSNKDNNDNNPNHSKNEEDDDDYPRTKESELVIEQDPFTPNSLSDSPIPADDFIDDSGIAAFDDDLIAALLSFGIQDSDEEDDDDGEDQRQESSPVSVLRGALDEKENLQPDSKLNLLAETLSLAPLPEIELDFGQDNLLVNPEELLHTFGHQEGESEYTTGGQSQWEVDELTDSAIDRDTEDLYRELARMSLQAYQQNEGTDMSEDDFGSDQLPSMPLFCVPCTPADDYDIFGSGLAPIEEEEPPKREEEAKKDSIPVVTSKKGSGTVSKKGDGINSKKGFSLSDLPMFCQPCTPADEYDPFESIRQKESQPNQETKADPSLVAYAAEFAALLEQNPGFDALLEPQDDDVDLMEQLEPDPIWEDTIESPPGNAFYDEVMEYAEPFVQAFGLVDQLENSTNTTKKPPSKERTCYGHREKIFGVAFSECGKYFATASQDSTICIWNVKTNSLLTQLKEHSKAFECLRVAWASKEWASQVLDRSSIRGDFAELIATSGADGVVKLWACPDVVNRKSEWNCVYTLDHGLLAAEGRKMDAEASNNDESKGDAATLDETANPDDNPQTYALQFIDHWHAFNTGMSGNHPQPQQNSFLMTSSDDLIHFWEIETSRPNETVEILEDSRIRMVPDTIRLREVMSLYFGDMYLQGYGVSVCSITGMGLPLPPSSSAPRSSDNDDTMAFGGQRNPDGKVFVFDAAYCKANGLLGAALSDGSLRLINGRGICVSILHLPGSQSHLTSFSWDKTGTRLATTVASGHLITWTLELGDVQGQGKSWATCVAIMEGGHSKGRPLFGSRFCGKGDNVIMSWSVDGTLCLWDAYSQGNIFYPIALLKDDPKYPIYAVELSKDAIAVCGGGDEGGFIGIPVYLYNIEGHQDNAVSGS